MINPNRIYNAKQDATIVKIESIGYMPWITIRTDDGKLYDGYLPSAHTHWKALQVGQRVGFGVQFSITADKFQVATLVKRQVRS